MPCKHKFLKDLSIDYATWEVKTLFIGTFNPEWNSCGNNYSNWFYGRTGNNEFWCILPKIHENYSLINGNRWSWIDFCERNKIAITDILTSLDNAVEDNLTHQQVICGFKDDELSNFENTTTGIIQILMKHPTIKQICITRQDLPEFWQQAFKETFDWINDHPERNISVKFLRSPSRGARRGVVGNFCEFIANRWLEQGYEIF